jgi:transaldolase
MKSERFGGLSQVPYYIVERDVLGLIKQKSKSLLEELRTQTTIVADPSDFESMKLFNPVSATSSVSVVYEACQTGNNRSLVDKAIAYARNKSDNKKYQLNIAFDKLLVAFGLEILKNVEESVFVEVDARLLNNAQIIVWKVNELVRQFGEAGVSREKIIFKIAATWEGIKAAEQLLPKGIRCNLILILSMPQAIACADAKVQLISPSVGLLFDWYLKHNKYQQFSAADEPGVILVKNIYNYYKKFDYKTEIVAVDFRNIQEICELSGCDSMAITPDLLNVLTQKNGIVERKLTVIDAKESDIKRIKMDEEKFIKSMNHDLMATDKLEEGVHNRIDDALKLDQFILAEL